MSSRSRPFERFADTCIATTTAVAGVTAAIVLSVATPPLTVLSPGAGCCRPARLTRPAPGLLHKPGTGPPGLTSSHRQAHEPGDDCSPDSPTNASSAAASVKHLVSSSRTACGKPRNRARSSPGNTSWVTFGVLPPSRSANGMGITQPDNQASHSSTRQSGGRDRPCLPHISQIAGSAPEATGTPLRHTRGARPMIIADYGPWSDFASGRTPESYIEDALGYDPAATTCTPRAPRSAGRSAKRCPTASRWPGTTSSAPTRRRTASGTARWTSVTSSTASTRSRSSRLIRRAAGTSQAPRTARDADRHRDMTQQKRHNAAP